jgi:hypothetical protein
MWNPRREHLASPSPIGGLSDTPARRLRAYPNNGLLMLPTGWKAGPTEVLGKVLMLPTGWEAGSTEVLGKALRGTDFFWHSHRGCVFRGSVRVNAAPEGRQHVATGVSPWSRWEPRASEPRRGDRDVATTEGSRQWSVAPPGLMYSCRFGPTGSRPWLSAHAPAGADPLSPVCPSRALR